MIRYCVSSGSSGSVTGAESVSLASMQRDSSGSAAMGAAGRRITNRSSAGA